MNVPIFHRTSPRSARPGQRVDLLQRQCRSCGQHIMAGNQCSHCQKTQAPLQGRTTDGARPALIPPIVDDVVRSPGQPLDATTRSQMESRFGHDFSQVRVHADERAGASAQAVSARAYTVKHNVVFGAGQYAPGTATGQRLLAHELAHVVQQQGLTSPVQRISSPADPQEQEASMVADNIHSAEPLRVRPGRSSAAMLMREIISANPSPSGGGGRPPAGLPSCYVALGGRLIDHWLAGTLGFRHLYIDVYEGPSNYALIEGGPVGATTGGTSGAWVKAMDWDARGIHWDITPTANCPSFASCLKRKTADYHAAAHPYHYSSGPNSNSFAWWVLNQCGLNISPLISSYPYLGVDYWTRPATAPVPVPIPVTP